MKLTPICPLASRNCCVRSIFLLKVPSPLFVMTKLLPTMGKMSQSDVILMSGSGHPVTVSKGVSPLSLMV